MKHLLHLLQLMVLLTSLPTGLSKKMSQKEIEKEMFGSKSLKCLVCRSLVDEILESIAEVNPKKKTRITGSDTRNVKTLDVDPKLVIIAFSV